MMSDTPPNLQQRLHGRRILMLLLAIFLLPVVIVVSLHYFNFRPEGHSHGTLITPPRPLQLDNLAAFDGQPLPATQWQDHWQLIYVSKACATDCQAQIHMLRQVHVSMNKEMNRIQRILVVTGPEAADVLQTLHRQYPDQVILGGDSATSLADQLASGSEAQTEAQGVYLIDPLGNLMMRYGTDFDPKGLREDLTRLLKYSWVG